MAQATANLSRKRVQYKGKPAWLYENGMIKHAKTGQIMRGGARVQNDGGLPIEVTDPDVLERIRYALSIDCNIAETCIYAGIHYLTLRAIFQRNPDFAQEMAKVKLTVPLDARKTVAKEVQIDPKVALTYLKAKRSREYVDRSEVDHNVTTPVTQITRQVVTTNDLANESSTEE